MSLFRSIARRLAAWELAAIGVLAPFLLLPSLNYFLTAVAAVLLIAVWGVRWIGRGVITRRTPFDPFILALMLMIPIGIWASPLLKASIDATTRILWGIALYYALVNSIDHEQALFRSMALALSGGVLIALIGLVTSKGILLSSGIGDKIAFLTPLYSILPDWSHLLGPLAAGADSSPGGFHPNVIGSTLAVLLPTAAMHFATRRRNAERVLSAIGVVLMVAALILMQSRLALVALAIATGVSLLRYYPRLRLPALGVTGVAAIAIVLIGPERVFSFLTSVFAGRGLDSWDVRNVIWQRALQTIGDFPFTGIGLSVFYPVSTYLYSFDFSSPWAFGHAHSSVLQMGADLGVVGLIGFVGMLIRALRLGWPSNRQASQRLIMLRAGAWSSLLVYILFGLFDALPMWTKSGFIVWVLLAWMVIGWRIDHLSEQEVKTETQPYHRLVVE